MTKNPEKKIDSVILLCLTNIIFLIFIYFLYDIFYVILGHTEYFLVDTRFVTIGDYFIIMRLREIAEPYVLIGFLLASIYSIYCVKRISKFKKNGKKYKYLFWLNILILFYYILGWFIVLLNPVAFKGLLS